MKSPSLSTLPPTVTVPLVIVDVQIAAADDAGLAHLPADQGRVRAGAAEGRQNALGDLHAAQVFGAGFAADEDQLDRWIVLEPFGLPRRSEAWKTDLARGGAGAGVDALGQQPAFGSWPIACAAGS